MHTYLGFCPIAKAVEILGDRWTLLIIRELLCGSHRFTELHYGLPGIPRSLLVQRLRMLEQAEVIERRAEGKRVDYHLTPAGQELFDIVWGLGEWGQRWVTKTIEPKDVDPQLLMWDMHRRIYVDRLPSQRVVAQFDFQGVSKGSYWLVLEKPTPSVCWQNLGFDIDLLITTDTIALHRVWMGHLTFLDAMREGWIKIDGLPNLVKDFPSWLALSLFAGVTPLSRQPA
jgi:DNA-binding HxlR family transcriptional regulator